MSLLRPEPSPSLQYDPRADPWQPWQEAGWLEVITLANPAAGTASFTRNIPGETWEMPIRFIATLTADANVANRHVRVRFLKDGVSDVAQLSTALLVTAGTSGVFDWERGQTLETSSQTGWKRSPMPDIIMAPGGSMIVTVVGVQVGDTLTNIQYTVMRWRNKPRRHAAPGRTPLAL